MTRPMTEASDLTTLIERLEAAEAGSRELDVALCIAFNYVGPHQVDFTPENLRPDESDEPGWLDYEVGRDQCTDDAPKLTTSLDAALALAERLDLDVLAITNEAVEALAVSGWSSSLRTLVPELARHACIAILKAKEASQ